MKKQLIIAAFVVGTAGLRAEEFFQASLTPDIAIHTKSTEIRGITLNVWGENPQHSLHLGFVNGSTGDSGGLSWGLVNYFDSFTGVSWGLVNISKDKFTGWSDGLVNVSQGTFIGVQSGWINVAKEFHGLQYGLVNYSENLRGVQIGFVNVARNNSWFKEFPDKLATGFPIVNWSF